MNKEKFLFSNLTKLRNLLGITLVEHVEQTIPEIFFAVVVIVNSHLRICFLLLLISYSYITL